MAHATVTEAVHRLLADIDELRELCHHHLSHPYDKRAKAVADRLKTDIQLVRQSCLQCSVEAEEEVDDDVPGETD